MLEDSGGVPMSVTDPPWWSSDLPMSWSPDGARLLVQRGWWSGERVRDTEDNLNQLRVVSEQGEDMVLRESTEWIWADWRPGDEH